MKLEELREEIVWEDAEMVLVAIDEGAKEPLKLTLKGKAGKLIKDVDALAKKGIQKAGIIGAYATDYLKRYKFLKKSSNRSIAFYARNIWERKSYQSMVDELKKTGHYKLIRSFPYPGGGRMWELRRK